MTRCLQKDRKRRKQDILDARIEIEETLAGNNRIQEAAVAMPRRPKWLLALSWILALAASAAIIFIWNLRAPPATSIAATYVKVDPGERLTSGFLNENMINFLKRLVPTGN